MPKKETVEKWLEFYFEAWVCFTNARSLDVFYKKTFAYTGKTFNPYKLDLMITVGLYISMLSDDCIFIIKCKYLPLFKCDKCGGWIEIDVKRKCDCDPPDPYDATMSHSDIANIMNEIKNTKKYYPKLIEEMYEDNKKEVFEHLNKAGLIYHGLNPNH